MVGPIIETMSNRRFDTYLHAAGHDQGRALELYIWNAKLGASFHIPIQAVEIALRNRINHALVAEFGPDWWDDARFLGAVDRERERDLETVKARVTRRGKALDTDQIVAGLSFGFWVGMLQPRYNPQVWGKHLRTSFPGLPVGEGRQSLFSLGGKIANFRNRISHHEPLLKANAMGLYSDLMRLIGWLCPTTATWVKPHCDVPKLVRQKP